MVSGELTVRQRRALTALLGAPTMAAAAKSAGVSERTIYRYLADPAFQAALREAQGRTLRMATARLTALLVKSLDVLGQATEPGHGQGQLRLRAAQTVVRHYAAMLEAQDLEERITRLEKRGGR